MLNTINLCAGVGGGTIAMLENNYTFGTSYDCENDPKVLQGKQAVLPNSVNVGAIEDWKSWNLSDIDFIGSSLPCQSHSMQGGRKGLASVNGGLVFYAFEIFAHYKPKYIFMENVSGITSSTGDSIGLITNELEELGYNVQHGLLNSDSFSPQSRSRYYIVARRKDLPNFELTVLEQPSMSPDCIEDIMDSAWRTRKVKSKTFDVAECIDLGKDFEWKQGIKHTHKALHVGKFDTTQRVHCPSGKSPTVVRCTGGGHEIKVWQGGTSWCKVNSNEMMKLQTFPEWCIDRLNASGLAEGMKKNIAGNAFNVRTIQYILDRLFLDEDKY